MENNKKAIWRRVRKNEKERKEVSEKERKEAKMKGREK